MRKKSCRLLVNAFWRLPNAGPQAPPIAGATQERRLLAVACRPMLGWGCPRSDAWDTLRLDTNILGGLPEAQPTSTR